VPLGASVLTPSRLARLRELLHGLERLDLSVEEVQLRESSVGVVLAVGGGRLLFRDESDFRAALGRLEALLSEQNLIPRQGEGLRVEYIDLRYGNKIYFK